MSSFRTYRANRDSPIRERRKARLRTSGFTAGLMGEHDSAGRTFNLRPGLLAFSGRVAQLYLDRYAALND